MQPFAKHLEALKLGQVQHSIRIDELRKQIKLQEDEIGAHSLILALGGSDQVLEALAQFSEDADFRKKVQGKELEYLSSLGVGLPADTRISVTTGANDNISVEIRTRSGEYAFRIAWDSITGFVTGPIGD